MKSDSFQWPHYKQAEHLSEEEAAKILNEMEDTE